MFAVTKINKKKSQKSQNSLGMFAVTKINKKKKVKKVKILCSLFLTANKRETMS